MICSKCAEAADQNRLHNDNGAYKWTIGNHPENCGCTCQHKMPEQWEKQFSVEQPDVK